MDDLGNNGSAWEMQRMSACLPACLQVGARPTRKSSILRKVDMVCKDDQAWSKYQVGGWVGHLWLIS